MKSVNAIVSNVILTPTPTPTPTAVWQQCWLGLYYLGVSLANIYQQLLYESSNQLARGVNTGYQLRDHLSMTIPG